MSNIVSTLLLRNLNDVDLFFDKLPWNEKLTTLFRRV